MTIFQQASKLKLQESLPSKEAIQFLEGTPYKTGSDYPDEYLNTPVEDLESMHEEEKEMRKMDAEDILHNELSYGDEMSWAEQHGACQDKEGEWNV